MIEHQHSLTCIGGCDADVAPARIASPLKNPGPETEILLGVAILKLFIKTTTNLYSERPCFMVGNDYKNNRFNPKLSFHHPHVINLICCGKLDSDTSHKAN